MAKLLIKVNELSPTIIGLIDKIQLLESPFYAKDQKLKCKREMLELVDHFRDFFVKAVKTSDSNEQLKIFKDKIERAFSQFEWDSNVAISPCEFKKFSENCKFLISSVLKLLGRKGCGILIAETYLKLCVKVTTTMRDNVEKSSLTEEKSNFKLILEGFYSTACILSKYWHISFSENQKSGTILCLHQICKILPFLFKMIKLQNLYLKKYSLNLLLKCLTRMLEEIHSDENIRTNDCGEEFIRLMDFSLYKLNELSSCNDELADFIEKANATSSSLKPAIDEILFYVMSIAQVTNFETDNFEIVTASQKVLREFNELNNEIEKENLNEIKLNASSLGESLCNLEQKVNVAVLRLVLEVFSGVNSPLKNIVNKCRTDIAKHNKALTDLQALISSFDSEMDRIMQIGFFAISCTTNLNRILKIRSCLASLESLETELIPSLTALYLDCTANNKANFQYLMDFWLNEITELKILIDSIIDPAGFCGVVKTQVQSLVGALKEDESFPEVCLNKVNYSLKHIIKYTRKLLKTLKTSLNDEDEIDEKTTDYLKKLQLGVQECEGILGLLDKNKNTDKIVCQAMKKCDFLLNTLIELSGHLFAVASEAILEDSKKNEYSPEISKLQIPLENYYKLYEPSKLTPTPLKIPEVLTPYVNTGILRSKRRNILYTSQAQTKKEAENNFEETLLQTWHWDKTPVSRKRSRCCKPLTLNLELGNTIDLEMATILESITEISRASLSENPQVQAKEKREKESVKNKKDVGCEAQKDFTRPSYKSSGCCAKLDGEENQKDANREQDRVDDEFVGSRMRNRLFQSLNDLSHNSSLVVEDSAEGITFIETPDRESDLKLVEERINFLKEQVPCMLP